MKEFAEWNNVKIETDETQPTVRIREGEVRWCRVGINIGNEVLGKGSDFLRPVMIVKKFSADVFVGIPLTSKLPRGSWFYPIEQNGVLRTLILNQARLFDRKRLKEKNV